jgi:hypothetical protein
MLAILVKIVLIQANKSFWSKISFNFQHLYPESCHVLKNDCYELKERHGSSTSISRIVAIKMEIFDSSKFLLMKLTFYCDIFDSRTVHSAIMTSIKSGI